MIERSDNAEGIEPKLAKEPMANAEANDPMEPIDRIEPTLPTDRMEFLDLIERIEPSDRIERQEPWSVMVLAGSSAQTYAAPARTSQGMMTTMTTPHSGDVAAGQDRLAQASRLIRSAQSLAEKIAELTEDELARLSDERGNIVPGAIAADSTNARAADRLTVGGAAFLLCGG